MPISASGYQRANEMMNTDLIGYLAAGCVFLTFYMKTMVPLRVAGIASNILFIVYGYAELAYPVLVLHLVLLPLNVARLHQILTLIRNVEEATRDDGNMGWVKPFSSVRAACAGETIFRKGDPAHEMFFVVSGRFLVKERGVDHGPGNVFGELGLLSSGQTRTATVECLESGQLLRIGYDQVKQLYVQDTKFGFYFLHLISRRLFENMSSDEAGRTAVLDSQTQFALAPATPQSHGGDTDGTRNAMAEVPVVYGLPYITYSNKEFPNLVATR
jgi:CRP/FNR family transcriptional regulator, cyclic AMP receptor protein